MKPVKLFILPMCPYCRQALSYVKELCEQDARYAAIPMEIIDESRNRALANSYDYYLVPTFYVDEVKAHEGIVSMDTVKRVFEQACG